MCKIILPTAENLVTFNLGGGAVVDKLFVWLGKLTALGRSDC